MTHTTISGWWCVSFNFINSLMVECIIQFHQHTDGGVYHSISSTHWWWCVSFNFISVCWWNLMTYSTISVLLKLNDTHHHQWLNEIEWHIPPSVCWWNWMTHTTLSVVNKLNFHQHTDGWVYHSISSTHWWWCVSFNFINTLMVVCIIQFH
jgi:hypothetical protein